MESLPSEKTTILNVPNVKHFVGRFQYNFFTKNERTSFNKENRTFPRKIVLTWLKNFSTNQTTFIDLSFNKDKIINEGYFSSKYHPINFNDVHLDKNVQSLLDFSSRLFLAPNQTSLQQKLNLLNDKTSDSVQIDVLSRVNEKFNEQHKSTKIQINNKVLNYCLKSSLEKPTTPFSNEIKEILDSSLTKQNNSISNQNSQFISEEDYQHSITEFVKLKPSNTLNFNPSIELIGYVISKHKQELGTPTYTQEEDVVINNIDISSFDDTNVLYGYNYIYEIKTVALVTVLVFDETNTTLEASFLVSSDPVFTSHIETTESTPPPCPADFEIVWDYNQKAPLLKWCLTVNPQRDIKKFQVFKRKTINEPFELIKMYDFDDSEIKTVYFETPEEKLIENNFSCFFLDKEFNDSGIYTLCSIDAHGMSSNYSMQFEVTFNKFLNKIKTKLISHSGAPKPFPNAYILIDAFVDTIKTEGHSKLSLYFNPEFTKVVNVNNTDVGLLKSKYCLQILNTDLQKQTNIVFNLEKVVE